MERAPIDLFVASTNKKKLAELLKLLDGAPVRLVNPADITNLPEVEETGETFEANAQLKAVSASLATGMLALADDSGLEVGALRGAPGVRSARYASTGPENASDEANRNKLLLALRGVPAAERTARFRCAIAVAFAEIVVIRAAGVVEGSITTEERGAGGFGYDPLFVPFGFTKTFAEMEAAEKAHISHRGRALAELKPRLLEYLTARGER